MILQYRVICSKLTLKVKDCGICLNFETPFRDAGAVAAFSIYITMLRWDYDDILRFLEPFSLPHYDKGI